MTHEHPERRGAGIFSGLLFLAAGLFLLAGNLNFFPLRPSLARLWPIVLVIIGIKHLIVFRGSRAWLGAAFWIGTGALFLSTTLGYLNIGWSRLIWPVMIIWFGVSLFLGDPGRCGRHANNGSGS